VTNTDDGLGPGPKDGCPVPSDSAGVYLAVRALSGGYMRNWLIAILGVGACGGDDGSEPNVPVATVTVTPPSLSIQVGATVQLQAATLDGNGGTLTGRQIAWATSDIAIATVSSSGLVTGLAEGDATVTATSETKIGSATVTVQAVDQPGVGLLRTGGNSSCAMLEEDGSTYCWGANEFGQLGDGTTTDRLTPTRIVGVPLYSVPLPGKHSCVLDQNALLCWGRNLSGEVGVGNTDPVHTPAIVSGDLTFSDFAVGDDFTCGTANEGTYCWGANDFGQLGTGQPGDSPTPVLVAGNHQFRLLAAAGHTVCGNNSVGEVYCWGNGADGELGNGQFGVTASTPTLLSVPFQISWIAIGSNAAGQATVCASGPNGTYCWGKNSDGEIGDGTKLRKSVPTQVIGLPGGILVAPGGSHTCALTRETAVFCWGEGGRLGTGSEQGSVSPVAIAGGLDFIAIVSGLDHTCAWTGAEPHQAYCWGDNTRGQLGDGTTTARLTPTRVLFSAADIRGRQP